MSHISTGVENREAERQLSAPLNFWQARKLLKNLFVGKLLPKMQHLGLKWQWWKKLKA